MPSSLRVLITTIGGLTSPDIIKAVRDNGERDVYIVGVDPFEYPTGRTFVDRFYICPSSAAAEEKFVGFIGGLAQRERIDVVIPCGNEDNLVLARYPDALHSNVMVSPYERLVRAFDKGKVYQWMAGVLPEHAPRFRIVNTHQQFVEAIHDLGYPARKVVIKPRGGRGGRGVYTLSSAFNYDLIFHSKPNAEFPIEFFDKILPEKEAFEDLIVMEHLNSPFFSVYSLCRDGENIISLNHTREWGNASQTFRGLVEYDPTIEAIAAKVNREFGLSYTNNMELATADDGRIVLFDLNPRIGASSGIDRHIGLNFPYLAIKLFLNERVDIDKNAYKTRRRFVRYFDEAWLDA